MSTDLGQSWKTTGAAIEERFALNTSNNTHSAAQYAEQLLQCSDVW